MVSLPIPSITSTKVSIDQDVSCWTVWYFGTFRRHYKHRAYHSWQLVFRNPEDFRCEIRRKSAGFHETKNVSFCVMIKYRSFFRKTNKRVPCNAWANTIFILMNLKDVSDITMFLFHLNLQIQALQTHIHMCISKMETWKYACSFVSH